MSGTYEARFPPKADGWFEEMKMTLRGPRARRHMREDREMNAVKRYGQAGLKLKFHDVGEGTSETGKAENGGDNHKVEVFMGDTIRDFKLKVGEACTKEAEFWNGKGKQDLEQKFRDITIGFKHLVMVFVPSAKVQRLYAQKLHEGSEYKHAYNLAIQDPSSWQPLDPTRTFGQYPQFGFGRKQPQLLRIAEATEAYKILNLRYKEFDKEQQRKTYKDTNEDGRCFGYAKYWHEQDMGPNIESLGASGDPKDKKLQVKTRDFEWRPAFISQPQESKGTTQDRANMKYNVEWVFKPYKLKPAKQQRAPQEKDFEIMKRSDVLLAPRCPVVDAYTHPAHYEWLEQAKTFRALGKSDWEIEVMLNKSMDEKWAAEHKAADEGKPPRITVDIIRSYLQRQADDEAAKARSGGGGSGRSGSGGSNKVGAAKAAPAGNKAGSK
jgi:hypothetical protein